LPPATDASLNSVAADEIPVWDGTPFDLDWALVVHGSPDTPAASSTTL